MPQVDSELVRSVAYYGEVYEERFLRDIDGEALRRDWYEALTFFLSKAFFQGRQDEISDRFLRNTVKFLDDLMRQRRDFQLLKNYGCARLPWYLSLSPSSTARSRGPRLSPASLVINTLSGPC